MKIELSSPYNSIGALTCPELPDFAVLIGRNGAGKTQLLQAIQSGHAVVLGVPQDQIQFYDMDSFRPPDNEQADLRSNQFARETARYYMYGEHEQKPSPVSVASEIFKQHTAEVEAQGGKMARDNFVKNLRQSINSTPEFSIFLQNPGESSGYLRAFHDRVVAPLQHKQQRKKKGGSGSRTSGANSLNNNPGVLLTTAMKLTSKLPHELMYEDFLRASHYEGSTIENTISQVFAAYKVDQYDWVHAQFEANTRPVSYTDLVDEYQHRNTPPWDTLRGVLAEMRDSTGEDGLFDFDFLDPVDLQLDMTNRQSFSFKSTLTNRASGARYELHSLSSGEKILMALCLASFNQKLGRRRPSLLLLDELDTVLHPSMVTALVVALRSLFVDRGCNVIMTTHSPMTVSALLETDVFRVVRNGKQVSVTPTTAYEAIEELSEGIATLDSGLRIAASHEAEVIILTEGNNTLHLKRWVELNFPDQVHIFDQLPKHRDKGQLLAYGRLLAATDPESHFIVVWDCDAAEQAQTLREELRPGSKVTPFAFERRENEIARHGIENNYDESILSQYAISKFDSEGRELGREFPKNRKTEFANHVRQNGTNDYFANFGKLRTVVEEILASRTAKNVPNGSPQK